MTVSTLPLSYCTNVHPGRTLNEVETGLDQYTVPIRHNYGSDLAAGLWLAAPVIRELRSQPDTIKRFADGLLERGLRCYTLNAFPYGDFHSARVKENVYLPDWENADRLNYTIGCAQVLAELLPEGADGSISTVPLGFKPFEQPAGFADRCATQLVELASQLDKLYQTTGRTIILAINPEPFCVLETTAETIDFFTRLRSLAADRGQLANVQNYLGVCYDVCHQSVEFEDVVESIRSLVRNQIRINKVHITCAIEIANPQEHPEALTRLSSYVEPRYLHQTFAKTADNRIVKYVDLDQSLTSTPDDDFRNASMWRVHFHVPVNAESLGPLQTTRSDLKRALTVVPELDYAPHLEVETYTWEVLPGGGSPNIVDGFSRELIATQQLLSALPTH